MKKVFLFIALSCCAPLLYGQDRPEISVKQVLPATRMPAVFNGNRDSFVLSRFRLDRRLYYGTCTLAIHFDAEGNVRGNPVVVKAASRKLSRELIRIVKRMPAWRPALRLRDSKPVPITVDIQFSIPRAS